MWWNFTDINDFEKIKISDKDLLATIWSIILIFVGVTGNLLTLLAIPYAKWKNKYIKVYSFYQTILKTSIPDS